MKRIELTPYEPPLGMEYMASSYPGVGAYLLPSGDVVVTDGAVTWQMPAYIVNTVAIDSRPASPSDVSMDFVLKAIAVTQKPELAFGEK